MNIAFDYGFVSIRIMYWRFCMSFVPQCACGCGKKERQGTRRQHGWFALTQDSVNLRTTNTVVGILRFATLECISSWLNKRLEMKSEISKNLESQVAIRGSGATVNV